MVDRTPAHIHHLNINKQERAQNLPEKFCVFWSAAHCKVQRCRASKSTQPAKTPARHSRLGTPRRVSVLTSRPACFCRSLLSSGCSTGCTRSTSDTTRTCRQAQPLTTITGENLGRNHCAWQGLSSQHTAVE